MIRRLRVRHVPTALLLMIASGASAASLHAQSGAVLTVDAAVRGMLDTNPDRSLEPLSAYGGSGDILLRAANRLRAPTLQLEYAASLRETSPAHPADGAGHRVNMLLGVPFAGWLRADVIGRGSRGGTDEELATGDELMLASRIDLLPARTTRMRSYGAYRWRTTAAAGTEPSIGRYAGLELRQRVRSTILLADARYEEFLPPDHTRDWQRRAVLVGIGQPLFRNTAIEAEARFREREYPRRLVDLADGEVPRRDSERRFGVSLVFDNGTGTEIRLELEREQRRSNDVGRAWDADRATFMVRQRLFALGARRDPPRIDERPGTDALRDVRSIIAARSFTDVRVAGTGLCAIAAQGALCWPSPTSSGVTDPPVLVPGSWTRVEAGDGRACGIDPDGRVHCWIWRDGSRSAQTVEARPRVVRSDLRFVDLAVGATHTCALTHAGAAYCWGENHEGQLGTGLARPADEPTAVAGGLHFSTITVGVRHTCALDMQGAAYCWGANESGQSAAGTRRTLRPKRIEGHTFTTIDAGARHTCALSEQGAVYCWGESARGQAGLTGGGIAQQPVRIESEIRFSAISAGWAHTCALSDAGQAWCWGANRHGQLGTGSTDLDTHPQPVPVDGARGFVAMSAAFRTCALDTAGQLYCWGGTGHDEAADRSAARPRRVLATSAR
jgi:alpha-tubulin suppressor-like RCC1 family protein